MLTMFATHVFVVLFLSVALIGLVSWLVWRSTRQDNTKQWPVTEGTIQTVRKVVFGGQNNPPLDVGDFSYIVNDEYYSGTLMISRSFSSHQAVPRDLIDQKIQVRYNPHKPEKYSVPQAELGGFLLDPYDGLGFDSGSVDLNIGNN